MGPGTGVASWRGPLHFLSDPGLWDGGEAWQSAKPGSRLLVLCFRLSPRGAENPGGMPGSRDTVAFPGMVVSCLGTRTVHPTEGEGWSQEAQIPRLDKSAAFGVFEIGDYRPYLALKMLLTPQENTPPLR